MTEWSSFGVQREERGDALWLLVSGELDIAETARLDEEIALAAKAAPEVVVDLSEVTFCDSSGLAVLLRARRRHDQLSFKPGEAVLHVATLGCVSDVLFGISADAADGSLSEDDAASQ